MAIIMMRFCCSARTTALVRTLYDSSVQLKKHNALAVSQSEYAKIIGSEMLLMNCTQPGIVYAVSRLNRYTHNPRDDHWNALNRLMRYLRGTMDLGLHYVRFLVVLEGYCDANWVTVNDDISSTSGFIFTLSGATVSSKSAKQTCIARSTIEAKFTALDLAGQEAEWLRNLLVDIPLWGYTACLSTL
ncbi:secreted RxLR effector protein 161-like [Silene latifolia]|uniref:secreted RxLR effector protein 161-like n=1 Tax=Silene latifolia TaxID=37657 RepID=UPI003D788A4F